MVRAFYLAYAAICYAIFFATFLYLVGFVGNFPFLRPTVDFARAAAPATAVAIDIALIALFGIQHSAMARPTFKAAWTRIVPAASRSTTKVARTMFSGSKSRGRGLSGGRYGRHY